MAVLDSLLNIRCGDSVLDYISQFNEFTTRLTSMDEKLGRDLKIAILLRGLPPRYKYLVSMIKVRDKSPELEEVVQLVLMESQTECTEFGMPGGQAHSAETVRCDHRNHDPSRCWKLHPELAPRCSICRQRGHTQRRCPHRRGDAVESPHDLKHVASYADKFEPDAMPITL
jgi:hypothetical protein